MASSDKLYEALMKFLQMDDNITIQQVLLFLLIAKNPGQATIVYGDKLHLPSSNLSRWLSILSKRRGRGQQGLDLIHTVEDDRDRRIRQVYLTPKGERFLRELEEILQVKESTK